MAEKLGRREEFSTVGLHEALDHSAEIGVVLDHPADLLDRMHHRRVVLVVEEPPDVRVGEIGQLAAEVHRDLAGEGDRLALQSGAAAFAMREDHEIITVRYGRCFIRLT